jgi:hypothetical protein
MAVPKQVVQISFQPCFSLNGDRVVGEGGPVEKPNFITRSEYQVTAVVGNDLINPLGQAAIPFYVLPDGYKLIAIETLQPAQCADP